MFNAANQYFVTYLNLSIEVEVMGFVIVIFAVNFDFEPHFWLFVLRLLSIILRAVSLCFFIR